MSDQQCNSPQVPHSSPVLKDISNRQRNDLRPKNPAANQLRGPDYAAVSIPQEETLYAVRLRHKELQAICIDPNLDMSRFVDRTQAIGRITEDSNDANGPQDAIFFLKSPNDIRSCVVAHAARFSKPTVHDEEEECVSSTNDETSPTSSLSPPVRASPLPNRSHQQERERKDSEDTQTSPSNGSESVPTPLPPPITADPTHLIQVSSTKQNILSKLHKDRPEVIVFTLENLPEFNMSKIICCFTVGERLRTMALVSKRLYHLVLQPQCFADVSFFPVVDDPSSEDFDPHRPPKILNVHGTNATNLVRTGITYVEVRISSFHPFIQKVAKYAGMWNFKAELWNKIDWPTDLIVESLQLSLDPNTNIVSLDLRDTLPETSRNRITNLFFIKFEIEGPQPEIQFPPKLQGIGLQSFTTTAFGSTWWNKQIFDGFCFESIRFLVLSCCDFGPNELQMIISPRGCPQTEHLSLRYVKWEGVIDLPDTLVSLGWFPERTDNLFRLPMNNKIWQLQTRLSENINATVDMLNCVHENSPRLRRIAFEYIRSEENWHTVRLDAEAFLKWEHDKRGRNLTIVVDPQQWEHQPKLNDVFEIDPHQFKLPSQTSFLDCPCWSEDAREFIRMTSRRKLLLR